MLGAEITPSSDPLQQDDVQLFRQRLSSERPSESARPECRLQTCMKSHQKYSWHLLSPRECFITLYTSWIIKKCARERLPTDHLVGILNHLPSDIDPGLIHYLQTSMKTGMRKCCIKTVPFKIFFKELWKLGRRGAKSLERKFTMAKLSNGRNFTHGQLFNKRQRNEKGKAQMEGKDEEWPEFQVKHVLWPR